MKMKVKAKIVLQGGERHKLKGFISFCFYQGFSKDIRCRKKSEEQTWRADNGMYDNKLSRNN